MTQRTILHARAEIFVRLVMSLQHAFGWRFEDKSLSYTYLETPLSREGEAKGRSRTQGAEQDTLGKNMSPSATFLEFQK